VPISVPAVPNKPGQQLVASVIVQSNGNQRFVVPVTLDVGGGPAATASTNSRFRRRGRFRLVEARPRLAAGPAPNVERDGDHEALVAV